MRKAHIGSRPVEDRLGLRQALNRPKTARRAPRSPRAIPEPPPAEPTITVPEEGAVLRIICATPLDRDTLDLRLALTDLHGVRDVGIDLASGAIDLTLGQDVLVPMHVLGLAVARCRLPVLTAELHRLIPGRGPSDESLIAVLR
jgi:hypothetical protein